jgi:hypothetical protein
MVPITALWLPILVSAVFVFLASSVIHMVLGYHKNDMRKLANEDDVQKALRALNIAPGDYAVPCAASMKDMKNPAFLEKMNKGPLVFMTVSPGGPPSMGLALSLWFLYSILVSVFAAYIAGRALTAESHYLAVFRFAGATAFTGYGLALLQNSIWYKRNWGTTLLSVFDGLLYALLTAGTFGWLWPR